MRNIVLRALALFAFFFLYACLYVPGLLHVCCRLSASLVGSVNLFGAADSVDFPDAIHYEAVGDGGSVDSVDSVGSFDSVNSVNSDERARACCKGELIPVLFTL